jgi:hypothetical protein
MKKLDEKLNNIIQCTVSANRALYRTKKELDEKMNNTMTPCMFSSNMFLLDELYG